VTATDFPRFGDAVPLTDQPRRSFVEQIMGLPISVHVRGPKARGPQVTTAVAGLFTALRTDDARFSLWKPNSPASRIRRGELNLMDADHRLREAAALCDEATRRTGGSFSAWLPGPDSCLTFDPTGLVKGWAVEQAFDALVERLAKLGHHDVLVSAGGDVVVSCARIDTPDWQIGVQDPRDRTRTLLTIPLRRGAVATSGTAARGQHIVDPATGLPPTGLLSATVIGPSLTWADVYATAAFVRGIGAGDWIASLAEHAGVLVDSSGKSQTVTEGRTFAWRCPTAEFEHLPAAHQP
jgi:thiamine biosynthesis lipoprotein